MQVLGWVGTWKKDGHGIVRAFPSVEKPKPIHETAMMVSPLRRQLSET